MNLQEVKEQFAKDKGWESWKAYSNWSQYPLTDDDVSALMTKYAQAKLKDLEDELKDRLDGYGEADDYSNGLNTAIDEINDLKLD